jgi:CxxC-x17-CxxC domain-containing protein
MGSGAQPGTADGALVWHPSTDPRDARGGRDANPGRLTPQEDRESVYQDRTLNCRDCSEEFTFSSGEQAFFASKGLLNDPQRCPSCRAVAKRARTNGGPREFHAAICGSCGGQAMVPFAPRNDRPVYCSSCFDKVRAGEITVHATV